MNYTFLVDSEKKPPVVSMAPGFSILQIDFQNIFAWNVIFIGHNKIIKINEQKISTWVSLWEKR